MKTMGIKKYNISITKFVQFSVTVWMELALCFLYCTMSNICKIIW